MKILLKKNSSGDDKEGKIQKDNKHIAEAIAQKADVICLPEVFLYSGDDEIAKVEKSSSRYLKAFQELAKTKQVNIILGSILFLDALANKPKNTCFVIDRQG